MMHPDADHSDEVLNLRLRELSRMRPGDFVLLRYRKNCGGMPLKIYSAARAVVDCFKFRNKLGLDVALEALRLARQRKRVQNRELLHYARLLRVEKRMSPYLQAIE